MKTFFVVDRTKNLQEGLALNLQTNFTSCESWVCQDLFNLDDLYNRIQTMYPSGLSRHGIQYLLSHGLSIFQPGTRNPQPIIHHIPMIEIIFELVRRNEFQDKPSRMQSIFGWTNMEDAENFNQENKGNNPIFEVTTKNFFLADQKLLLHGGSCIGALQLAKMYWSGQQGHSPKIEAIIPLPIKIGKKFK